MSAIPCWSENGAGKTGEWERPSSITRKKETGRERERERERERDRGISVLLNLYLVTTAKTDPLYI